MNAEALGAVLRRSIGERTLEFGNGAEPAGEGEGGGHDSAAKVWSLDAAAYYWRDTWRDVWPR